VRHISLMDDPLLSETDVEGTWMDADWYWRWIEAQRTALWFWQDWETAMAFHWEWKGRDQR